MYQSRLLFVEEPRKTLCSSFRMQIMLSQQQDLDRSVNIIDTVYIYILGYFLFWVYSHNGINYEQITYFTWVYLFTILSCSPSILRQSTSMLNIRDCLRVCLGSSILSSLLSVCSLVLISLPTSPIPTNPPSFLSLMIYVKSNLTE